MIASKVICDDTYSNKSWSIVGQGIFPHRELNQMEREMCSYLEWQLNIEPNALKEFEAKVRRDFKGTGPYPTYVLPSPASSPMPSTTPYTAQTADNASTPSFAARSQQPPSTSSTQPIPPPLPVRAGPPPRSASSSPHTCGTPDTPELSTSTSASPASSMSPSTPAEFDVQAATTGMVGTPMDIESQLPTSLVHISSPAAVSASVEHAAARNAPAFLNKVKCGEVFARASPCVW